MVRLFVGLALPPDPAARLAALAGGIPGARWVEIRNLHITLRFAGEVDEGQADDLDTALTAIRAPAFPVDLAGLGTFGGSKPHTLWAGVERAPDLVHLQERVEAAAVRAGLTGEARKYTPHVTLARCKGAPDGRLAAFIARNAPFRLPPFPVTSFQLFQSHLGRGGPEYEVLADYPLDSK